MGIQEAIVELGEQLFAGNHGVFNSAEIGGGVPARVVTEKGVYTRGPPRAPETIRLRKKGQTTSR